MNTNQGTRGQVTRHVEGNSSQISCLPASERNLPYKKQDASKKYLRSFQEIPKRDKSLSFLRMSGETIFFLIQFAG